jgi:PilZ domain
MTSKLVVPRRRGKREATAGVHGQFQSPLKATTVERRNSERFPIELRAEISIGQTCIVATTVNISSGGLLLTCDFDDFKARRRVSVRLTNWPSARGSGSVTLIVEGTIVRSGAGFVAISRNSYQFVEDELGFSAAT